MYSRCSGCKSSSRTVLYAPWVSAFLFPAGAPAPAAFLLPGCPPRFRGGFCASRAACHPSALFHLRTCAGVVPTISATCRAVIVPPDSSHTRRDSSRAGLLSRAMSRAPFRLISIFRPAYPCGSAQKTGHVQNIVRFLSSGRRGGMRRPLRYNQFLQYLL